MNILGEIDKYIKKGDYATAYNLCNSNDLDTDIRKVKILLMQHNISDAFSIAERPEYINEAEMQVLIVKHLISIRNYDEALEICDNKAFENNSIIMSQKMKILAALEKYDEVIKIANNPAFIMSGSIQRRRLICLASQGKEEEIEKICNNDKYFNIEGIVIFYMDFLISKGRYQDALNVYKASKIRNDNMYKRKAKISKHINEGEKIKTSVCDVHTNISKTIELLVKMYNGNISKEEILESDINDWDKEILLVSYYEKYNKQLGIKYIKELKNKYQSYSDKLSVLNSFGNIMASKKSGFFDLHKYAKCLGVNLLDEISKTQAKVEPIKKEEEKIRTMEKRLEVFKPNVKPVIPANTRVSTVTPVNILNHSNCILVKPVFPAKKEIEKPVIEKQKEVVATVSKPKTFTIKELYPNLCDEIQRHTYVLMQDVDVVSRNNAIKFYDNFELFMRKNVSRYTLIRFLRAVKYNFNSIPFTKEDLASPLKNKFGNDFIDFIVQIYDLIDQEYVYTHDKDIIRQRIDSFKGIKYPIEYKYLLRLYDTSRQMYDVKYKKYKK